MKITLLDVQRYNDQMIATYEVPVSYMGIEVEYPEAEAAWIELTVKQNNISAEARLQKGTTMISPVRDGKTYDWMGLVMDKATFLELIEQLEDYQKTRKVLQEKTTNRLMVRVKGGYLVADASTDPNYPGIDVEFVSDKDAGTSASRPRVLLEYPGNGELRALIWDNPASEDYTKEIMFGKEI